jgi:uncharacterized protein YyaL (SSP411 family)
MADSAEGINALQHETSPYLLQHAHNPVAWYPWGEEALERARREERPILLSIGYSACHWCHVMAHESFEDGETAALMNANFVNIKVDREERPDLDRIYQLSHQLLTRRPGGWPLTVFLTPQEHTPFFAGTYFPRESRYGMPAFRDILERVAGHYQTHRAEIGALHEQIVAALDDIEEADDPVTEPGFEPLDRAHAELARVFDERNGGFGRAPKFPHPTNMELLLRRHARTGEAGALQMAVHTLVRMTNGGIYDQLGGGFCRYSVDEQWMIPHFEKMLYDNGPLLALCAEASVLTADAALGRAARETAEWVMREMQSPDGGYYSTLDADSEGEEGKFYVWQRDEVASLLDPAELAVVELRYGLDGTPNFEGKAWHLHAFASMERVATACAIDVDSACALLDAARAKLLAARERRVRPGLDDKVLTAWNALMIRGMAVASALLGEPDWAASAEAAVDFLRERHWQDGRLLATSRGGRARLPAYLDDHAFLVDGLLALLQCRWRAVDLDFACTLADALLERFEDPERGGFYFTATDHERLLHRPKPFMDDALPSGNAIAARALGRLGHLLGEPRYLDAAERTVRVAWAGIERHPFAHGAMLAALEDWLEPPETVVLRGSGATLERWRTRATGAFSPRRLTLAIPNDAQDLTGLLAQRAPSGETVAYLCRGHHCEAPLHDFEAFSRALRASELDPA